MNKEDYDYAVLDFKIGFEKGGSKVNSSYAPFVSQALRDGDGKPMANYNKNKRVLNEIKSEIEENLSSINGSNQNKA